MFVHSASNTRPVDGIESLGFTYNGGHGPVYFKSRPCVALAVREQQTNAKLPFQQLHHLTLWRLTSHSSRYFGSAEVAQNEDLLKQFGITHVVNATKAIDDFFPGKFIYVRVRIDDDDNVDPVGMCNVFRGTARLLTNIEEKGGQRNQECV